MNYRKTKILLFIWIVIFIAMTIFVAYGFYKLEETKKYVFSLEQEVIKEKESINTFETLVRTTSNLKNDSEKASTFFIKRDEVINFFNEIEALASITNTKLSIQNVVDKKIESSNMILSVDINAYGKYSNIYHLIRLLEELPYQTEIQNIKISKGSLIDEKNQSTNNWSASINIVGVMF